LRDVYLEKGVACYARALERGLGGAEARQALQVVAAHRLRKKDFDGALTAYRKLTALFPKVASYHCDIGTVLQEKRDPDGAVAAYRKAIAIDANYALAHYNLGLVLQSQGKLKDARQALHRGHELGLKQPGWSQPSAATAKRIDRLVELEQQLPALEKGERKPASAKEQIELAEMCTLTRRRAASARFYAGAFTAQPTLADDLQAAHRYNAACAAALAVAGQAEDAAKLDDKERARLRKQVLDWLRADLALRIKQLESGKPADRAAMQWALKYWQQDSDLARLRDARGLESLPAGERAEWQRFWADVAALLKKAQGPAKSGK
jgi:Tfp pilus assembly protein PilF